MGAYLCEQNQANSLDKLTMKIRVITQESILGVVVGRLVWFRSWYSGQGRHFIELLVLPTK
jgi:hypothetical protein